MKNNKNVAQSTELPKIELALRVFWKEVLKPYLSVKEQFISYYHHTRGSLKDSDKDVLRLVKSIDSSNSESFIRSLNGLLPRILDLSPRMGAQFKNILDARDRVQQPVERQLQILIEQGNSLAITEYCSQNYSGLFYAFQHSRDARKGEHAHLSVSKLVRLHPVLLATSRELHEPSQEADSYRVDPSQLQSLNQLIVHLSQFRVQDDLFTAILRSLREELYLKTTLYKILQSVEQDTGWKYFRYEFLKDVRSGKLEQTLGEEFQDEKRANILKKNRSIKADYQQWRIVFKSMIADLQKDRVESIQTEIRKLSSSFALSGATPAAKRSRIMRLCSAYQSPTRKTPWAGKGKFERVAGQIFEGGADFEAQYFDFFKRVGLQDFSREVSQIINTEGAIVQQGNRVVHQLSDSNPIYDFAVLSNFVASVAGMGIQDRKIVRVTSQVTDRFKELEEIQIKGKEVLELLMSVLPSEWNEGGEDHGGRRRRTG